MWTSKVLGLGVAFSLLIAACGGAEASLVAEAPAETSSTSTTAPTEAPTETATPEPTEGPEYTAVVIDGQADDWDDYVNVATDRTGNADAGVADMVAIRAFNNDQFFYMAIYLADPSTPAKFSIALHTASGGEPEYEIWLDTGRNSLQAGVFLSGNMAQPDGAEMAQGEVIELKLPLSAFGDVKVGSSFIQSATVAITTQRTQAAPRRTAIRADSGDGLTYNPQRTVELEPAVAQAAVSGPTTSGLINSDETWSGEVHVTGDITLAAGVTLTIEPGTTVFLASNSDNQNSGFAGPVDEYINSHNDPVGTEEWDKNAILIDGRGGIIMAVGTEEEPIVFKPEGNSTSSAQWHGIYIERGKIIHSQVLYAGRTAIQPLGYLGEEIEIAYNEVRFFHWAGIDSHTHNVWIHHNVVEGGGHQAITAASGNVVEYNYMTNCQNAMFIFGLDVVVRNNIAVDCARGLQISGNIPAGSEITIVNNTILQLEGPPDGWYYQGTLIYPAFDEGGGLGVFQPNLKVTMVNNIVYGPFTWGIGMHERLGTGSVVDYNLIWGTDEDYIGSGASGIGSNNIFADPELTFNSTTLDYGLGAGSAAIDAGAPGTSDEDGSAADLGAYGGEFAYGW